MRSGDTARGKMRKGGWAPPGGGSMSYSRLRRLHLDSLVVQLRGHRAEPFKAGGGFSFTWHEPNAKRDLDNIAGGGTKLVLDAMIAAGVLEQDTQEWVRHICHGLGGANPLGPGVMVSYVDERHAASRSYFLRGQLPGMNELLKAREVGARRSVRRAP